MAFLLANNHLIYVLLTITSNRNATNMIKKAQTKTKRQTNELTEEVVLVSRFHGNTFLRVMISPVSGCIGS